MSHYLESSMTATLLANSGNNYDLALGIGVALEELDRTTTTLVSSSSVTTGDYFKFEADVDYFLKTIINTGDNNSENNREWEIVDTGTDISNLNTNIQSNFKGVKLTTKTQNYTFPITSIVKTYNHHNLSGPVNGTISGVSLNNNGGNATLTDSDFDSNNNYTFQIELSQTDDTKASVYVSMNLGTLTFTKTDNILAADYITVTKSLDTDASFVAPSIASAQTNANSADVLTANSGQITYNNLNNQISVSVTNLSITDGSGNGTALSGVIHQLIDKDVPNPAYAQHIYEIRHYLRNYMTSSVNTFRGIISTNTMSLSVPVDIGTKFNNTSWVTGSYTDASSSQTFSWSPKSLINWTSNSAVDWKLSLTADASDSILPATYTSNTWAAYTSNEGTTSTDYFLVKKTKWVLTPNNSNLVDDPSLLFNYINYGSRYSAKCPYPSYKNSSPSITSFENESTNGVPSGYYGIRFNLSFTPIAYDNAFYNSNDTHNSFDLHQQHWLHLDIPTKSTGSYGSNDNSTPNHPNNFFVGVTNNSYNVTYSGADGTSSTKTKYYVILKSLFSVIGPNFTSVDLALNIDGSGAWNTNSTNDGNMTKDAGNGVGGTSGILTNNINGSTNIKIVKAFQNEISSNYYNIEFDTEVILSSDGQHWPSTTYRWRCA